MHPYSALVTFARSVASLAVCTSGSGRIVGVFLQINRNALLYSSMPGIIPGSWIAFRAFSRLIQIILKIAIHTLPVFRILNAAINSEAVVPEPLESNLAINRVSILFDYPIFVILLQGQLLALTHSLSGA